MKARFSVSIHTDENEKFFGEGPYQLLRGIQRLGSLRAAAKDMNMAYTKAFRVMKRAEKCCGFPLCRKKIGGEGGGGSVLTPEAEKLMAQYVAFKAACSDEIDQLYEQYFSDIWPEKINSDQAGEEARRPVGSS